MGRRIVDLHDVLTRILRMYQRDAAALWLGGSEPLLGGARPIDVLVTEGAAPVIRPLDGIAQGASAWARAHPVPGLPLPRRSAARGAGSPTLPGSVRAIASYRLADDARICALDNAMQLAELGLRPSDVVSRTALARHPRRHRIGESHRHGRLAQVRRLHEALGGVSAVRVIG